MQRFDHRTPRPALTSAACALLAIALVVFAPETIVFHPILWVWVCIFATVGIASRLHYRNDRIEIEGDRIRKFDWLNRNTFDASLHEIRVSLDQKSDACIESPTGKTVISRSLRNYGRLIWQLQGRPSLASSPFPATRVFRFNVRTVIPYFLFTCFTGFFLCLLLYTANQPFLLSWFLLGFGIPLFVGFIYLHGKNSRVEMHPDGLRIFNLFNRQTKLISAREILDSRIIESDGDSPDVLWIYTAADETRIRSSIKDFDVLASLVNDLLNDRKAALTQRTAEENVEVH